MKLITEAWDQKIVKESLIDDVIYQIPFVMTKALNIIRKTRKNVGNAKSIEEVAELIDNMFYDLKFFKGTNLRTNERITSDAIKNKRVDLWWRSLFSTQYQIANLIQQSDDLEYVKHNVRALLAKYLIIRSIFSPTGAITHLMTYKK